jgi:flagellar hook-length control protein FliK
MSVEMLPAVGPTSSKGGPKATDTASNADEPSFGQLLASRQQAEEPAAPNKNDSRTGKNTQDNSANRSGTTALDSQATGQDQAAVDANIAGKPDTTKQALANDLRRTPAAAGEASVSTDKAIVEPSDRGNDADDTLPAGLVWADITTVGRSVDQGPTTKSDSARRGASADQTPNARIAVASSAALAPASAANGQVAVRGDQALAADMVETTDRATRSDERFDLADRKRLDLRADRDNTLQKVAADTVARDTRLAVDGDAASQNASRSADRLAAVLGDRQQWRTAAAERSVTGPDSSVAHAAGLSNHALAGQAAPGAINTAATPNPAMAATLSAPLGSEAWHQALNQQALRLTHVGDGAAELTLHPRDLGKLQVSLKMGEHAQLHFASAHADVRAAVEAALPQLRHAFADNGINLGQTSVSDQAPNQNMGQNANQDSANGQASAQPGFGPGSAVTAEPLAGPVTVTTLAGRTLDGGIDIFA